MPTTPDWTELRTGFETLNTQAYLNTAAEGLWPSEFGRGYRSYLDAKEHGAVGRSALTALEDSARVAVAGLLGADPATIAFLASTSRGIDVAIGTAAPTQGDNIVMLESEFPAAILAGQRLLERGIDVRIVPALDGQATERHIAERIDDRTRAVVVSAVSFITGRTVDIPELRRLIGSSGALLIVDAIQGVGVVPLPIDDIDLLVAGTYKWMLGPHGLGVLYANPRTTAHLRPPYTGWRGISDLFGPDRLTTSTPYPDARRFEEGMPNFLGLAALVEALDYLAGIGYDRVAQRALDHTTTLRGLLATAGIPHGPTDPHRAAAIVAMPCLDAEQVAALLAEKGVQVWGRSGVLRASPHFYNDETDLERLVTALPASMKRSVGASTTGESR